MSKEHLGLFDTPLDRRQVRAGVIIVGLLLAAFAVTMPFRAIPLHETGAFIPAVDAVLFVADLIAAMLLYSQSSVFRSRALTVLASGYLFAALLIIPHALSFQGAFAPKGLLGAGINTTAWIATVQRAAFPTVIILYVLLRKADASSPPDPNSEPRIVSSAVIAAMLALGVALLAIRGHDLLPAFYTDRADQSYFNALNHQAFSFPLLVVAMTMLLRTRRSVLDVWLLVALAGWMIQSVLLMTIHRRFTVGFYSLFAMSMVSHLVVVLALIAQSNRLYGRLALAMAARDRERDARMMSMDAVTAAISHEVGQPLAGVALNARAALNLLNRPRPAVGKAMESLKATIDAGHHTMAVIKSIRAMFEKNSARSTTFSLNDLVRETTALLELELVGEKVSLVLALDASVPLIVADRVQIQRVLVNLVINAIESLRVTEGRPRCIAIRSSPLERRGVLLEVSDTGLGIGPDEMPHIFEAFFTTKEMGTGLGLSLCRAIVEDHGGRLWATTGETPGATFHLELRAAA